MASKKSMTTAKMPMHKMPNGRMMTDAEMKKMMKAAGKKMKRGK